VLLEQCLSATAGGTGRYARELAGALAETAGAGDTVAGWVAQHADVSGIQLAGVGGPYKLPVPGRALPLLWERGMGPSPLDVDLVHAPTLLVPPKGRARLVVTIHDAVPWTHPETLTRRGVAFHKRMAERASRTADLIVTPTEAARAELDAVLDLGDRLVVVPPGLARSLAVPDDAVERRRVLGLPESYVLAVSTVEPRKGLDLLVRAVAWPPVEGPGGLSLVVAGAQGWGGVDVPALAAREGLDPERLHVLGRLSDADLASCFAGATVFAMTSRSEGFGLPLLEAMALGIPAVCTDIPALAEVAGGAAILVPPDPVAIADAITKLAADPEERAARAAAGRVRAADFSWNTSARTLWELYRSL
jgi:glycosyltransferase involved in cell wall biosynthesis